MQVSDELFTRRRVGASLVSGVATYSTGFPSTENPISEAGKWTNGLATGLDWTNVQTGLGSDSATRIAFGLKSVTNPPPFDDSVACLSGFGFDHSAQATMFKGAGATGQQEAELLLRWHIVAHGIYGYEIDCTPGGVYVVRWNGPLNDFTTLAGPISTNYIYSNGTVFYAKIVGSLITVRCNGATVTTYNTSSDTAPTLNAPYAAGQGLARYTDGNPGLGFYRDSTVGAPGNNNELGWSSYTATAV